MSFELSPDFKTTECQDFCARVADGTHDSPKETAVGKKLVTSKNVKGGRLELDSAYLISAEDFESINKRSKVDQWDLLLTMIGTVGEVCLVTDPEPDFAIKNVGLLKCGNELKAKWLYYFLRSPQGQKLIEARKKGSTQQYVSLTELRRLRACTRFCVNGLMAGSCQYSQRKRNDRKQRIDRPPAGGLQKA